MQTVADSNVETGASGPALKLPSQATKTLRIAVVPTPRTGNTWLRHLLGSVYSIPSTAVNSPAEIDWDALPERCVVALHWHPEPEFTADLERHGFKIVTMCRHPLDILISILHFASSGGNSDAYTAQWLLGEGGGEACVVDATPTSSRFLDYATGARARALLSVSQEWARLPGCLTMHYERLVQDTLTEVRRMCDALEPVPDQTITAAIDANTIDKLRRGTDNQHHWQGAPGLWRRLLPAAESREIAAAHSDFMDAFGYDCQPDESLELRQAEANWFALEIESLRRELRQCSASQKSSGKSATGRLDALHMQFDTQMQAVNGQLTSLHSGFGAMQNALGDVNQQLQAQSADTNTQIAALHAGFSGIHTIAAELGRQIESQNTQVAALHQGFHGLSGEIGRTQEHVEAVRAHIQTAVQKDFSSMHQQLGAAFGDVHTSLANAGQELHALHARQREMQAQIEPMLGMGAQSIRIARQFSRLAARFPRISGVVEFLWCAVGLGKKGGG